MPTKKRPSKLSTKEKALLIARVVLQKNPLDLHLLDVGGSCSFADFFLILSGSSTRQTQALAGHLKETMSKLGIHPRGLEGVEAGHWILMDYGEIIVHIFYEPVRGFYDLEGLWIEAPRLPLPSEESKVKVS